MLKNQIAHQLISVQPLSTPAASIFYMDFIYGEQNAKLVNEWLERAVTADSLGVLLKDMEGSVNDTIKDVVLSIQKLMPVGSLNILTHRQSASEPRTPYWVKIRDVPPSPIEVKINAWLAKPSFKLDELLPLLRELLPPNWPFLNEIPHMLLLAFADNPQTKPESLDRIVREGTWEMASAALRNPNLPKKTWSQYLFIDPASALQNEALPLWILEEDFVSTLSDGIVRCLATSDLLCGQFLNLLIQHASTITMLEVLLEAPSISPDQTAWIQSRLAALAAKGMIPQ